MNQYEKRATSKERIFALLSDGEVHTMRELNAISYRYGGRLHELRKAGHDIETIQVGVDEFAYRMKRRIPTTGVQTRLV